MRLLIFLIVSAISVVDAQALSVEKIYDVTPQNHKEIGVQVDVSNSCTVRWYRTSSEASIFVDITFPEKLDSGTFADVSLIATQKKDDVLQVDMTSAVHQDSKNTKRLFFCADKKFLDNLRIYIGYAG